MRKPVRERRRYASEEDIVVEQGRSTATLLVVTNSLNQDAGRLAEQAERKAGALNGPAHHKIKYPEKALQRKHGGSQNTCWGVGEEDDRTRLLQMSITIMSSYPDFVYI